MAFDITPYVDKTPAEVRALCRDGDYAHLQRVDQPEAELKLVARALLPADIYEGCELHYAMMQYSMK